MKKLRMSYINRLAIDFLKRRSGTKVAILAIILTSALFTSIFTVFSSINDGAMLFESKRLGNMAQGGFKNLTEKQLEQLKSDSSIKAAGIKRTVGTVGGDAFSKHYAEICYMDKNSVKWTFSSPEIGEMPHANSDEVLVDGELLGLIGADTKIGERVEFQIDLNGKSIKKSFVVSGIYKRDDVSPASLIIISESALDEILKELGGNKKTYDLNVMLKFGFKSVGSRMNAILHEHGYQSEDKDADNYIAIGVNNAYTSAKIFEKMDIGTIIFALFICIVAFLTAYLIIYNIFRISVERDIRFFGLMKAIGMTSSQFRKLIMIQGLILSMIGIPFGLFIGILAGNKASSIVIRQLNGIDFVSSYNYMIFVLSSIFYTATVLISIRRPAVIASKVPAVRAINFVAGQKSSREKVKRRRFSPFTLAIGSIVRDKKKTLVSMASISLALTIFSLVYTFVGSFDTNKYISHFVKADFLVSDASRMQISRAATMYGKSLNDEDVKALKSMNGIKSYGEITGTDSMVLAYTGEKKPETVEEFYGNASQIYGMDDLILSKLTLVDGSIEDFNSKPDGLIALVQLDDYDRPEIRNNSLKVGDIVNVEFVDNIKFPDKGDGKVNEHRKDLPASPDAGVSYENIMRYSGRISAICGIPYNFSYRASMGKSLVLPKGVLDAYPDKQIMYFACDAEKGAKEELSEEIEKYISKTNGRLSCESEKYFLKDLGSFKNMFIYLGSILSGIIGVIGTINFINTIVSSMSSRKKEHAVLRAVGMTRSQLLISLVIEGVIFSICILISSSLIVSILSPIIGKIIGENLWLFTYKFNLMPLIFSLPILMILGMAVPLLSMYLNKNGTILEMLRTE